MSLRGTKPSVAACSSARYTARRAYATVFARILVSNPARSRHHHTPPLLSLAARINGAARLLSGDLRRSEAIFRLGPELVSTYANDSALYKNRAGMSIVSV